MENIRKKILLWKAGLTGRDTVLEEIWRTYHPKLQVYVRNFGYGIPDESDMVSEILLKVFEKLHSYNARYAFSTWIYTLARNTVIDRMRKDRPEQGNIEEREPWHERTPEALEMENTEQALIRDAVAELNSANRELIYLHYYEELGYRDISRITGIPEGTIKYRMSESRKILKKKLERSFVS